MEEIFKDIKELDNLYQVSNFGRVFNIKRKKFIKCINNGSGYLKVMYHKKKYYVHRLVANAFIENPNNLKEVNHIDGNHSNNLVSNLEWVSHKGNMQHAWKTNLCRANNNCGRIKKIDRQLQNGDIIFYRCPEQASALLNVKLGTIQHYVSDTSVKGKTSFNEKWWTEKYPYTMRKRIKGNKVVMLKYKDIIA